MSHDENPNTSISAAERLNQTVRQLVLMRETGPKSAAWHRARVQMIWRLQRARDAVQDHTSEAHVGSEQSADEPLG